MTQERTPPLGWQGIETAPRDDTWILGYWPHLKQPAVCRWRTGAGRWVARIEGGAALAVDLSPAELLRPRRFSWEETFSDKM